MNNILLNPNGSLVQLDSKESAFCRSIIRMLNRKCANNFIKACSIRVASVFWLHQMNLGQTHSAYDIIDRAINSNLATGQLLSGTLLADCFDYDRILLLQASLLCTGSKAGLFFVHDSSIQARFGALTKRRGAHRLRGEKVT